MSDVNTRHLRNDYDDDDDGININPDDSTLVTESMVSIGSSEVQTETTESTRSLVHRAVVSDNDKDMGTENEDPTELVEREKTPESDTTAAPSIGPVILRDVKKRKRLERACSPDGGRGFSSVYAVMLVLISLVMSMKEALEKTWMTQYIDAAFITYLYTVSIVFILGVETHLLKRSKQRSKLRKERDKYYTSSPDTTLKKGFSASHNPAFEADNVFVNGLGANHGEHNSYNGLPGAGSQAEFCIVEQDENWNETMPHRTGLFLRIGTAVFGIASLIYFGLLVKQLHERQSPSACGDDVIIWPYYTLLLLIFIQTFFVFKRPQVNVILYLNEKSTSNTDSTAFGYALKSMIWMGMLGAVHIMRCKTIVRLGFMHLLASNVCIWTRTLIREVLNAYLLHQKLDVITNITTATPEDTTDGCLSDDDDDLLHLATPYLIPCVLEFSILSAASFYSLWADVAFFSGQSKKKTRRKSAHFDLPEVPVHLTEINFHKTHRGLFGGFIVFAAVAVSVVLFFSYLSTSEDDKIPMLIYICTDIALYAILIIAILITWLHLAFLTYNRVSSITPDEFLLFVAMIGLLVYNICECFATVQRIIDGSKDRDTLLIFCDNVLCMGLSLLQTSFIIEGYSRHSVRSIHLKRKPGRGGVTFLLIANMSAWVLRSFQLKYGQVRYFEPQEDMFGYLVWQIITYSAVPFGIFYHFQSSSCLAHIWIKSYRKDAYRDKCVSARSDDVTEAVTLVPTSGEIRIVELKRRVRKSTGVMEEDTVFSPVSVV